VRSLPFLKACEEGRDEKSGLFRPRGALVRSHIFLKSLYVWGSRDFKTRLFMVRGLFIKLKKVS